MNAFLRKLCRVGIHLVERLVVPIPGLILYRLSFLFPRRADLWAFGGSDDEFADNSKYLYLWISANCPDLQAIWITGRKGLCRELTARGYRVACRWSWTGMLSAIRAKLHVFDGRARDVCFPLSGGSLYVNLWHGVGIKNIEYAVTHGPASAFFRQRSNPLVRLAAWDRYRAPDMVLATSPTMSTHFARCFKVPVEHCPELGYPRLDVATDEDLKQESLTFGDYTSIREAFAAYDEIYVYMPTFRDSERGFFGESLPSLAALSKALRKRNALLYIKPHRMTRLELPAEPGNIHIWPKGLDIYPVLTDFDLLITDYSSVLYDYIFTKDHGVILYTFDYDRYLADERDLAFPFENNVIGVRVSSFAELCNAIETGVGLALLPSDKLKELRERFWGCAGGTASRRVSDKLRQLASL